MHRLYDANGITCLHHRAPSGDRDRALIVMLPGVGIEAREFVDHGFVATLHERGVAVDVIAACPDLDLYLDDGIATALHRWVIEPGLAQGYTRLWLLGISLGGMGALLYASAYAAHVEGLVLLAPFLGTRGTIAEMVEAGGLASWSASGSAATAAEIRMLTWLQDSLAQSSGPTVHVGYGTGDRFAVGHRMLAERLPAAQVVAAEGGHDWDTWLTLWRLVLDAAPFAVNRGLERTNDGQPDEAATRQIS